MVRSESFGLFCRQTVFSVAWLGRAWHGAVWYGRRAVEGCKDLVIFEEKASVPVGTVNVAVGSKVSKRIGGDRRESFGLFCRQTVLRQRQAARWMRMGVRCGGMDGRGLYRKLRLPVEP